MRNDPTEIEFTDGYGESRVVYRRKGRTGSFSVKRTNVTPILALNAEVSRAIGARIKELRAQRGLTLTELANRIGITSGHPKARMWAFENPGIRSTGETYGGLRLGTLYALAIALEVEVTELLPPVCDVSGELRAKLVVSVA